MQRWLAIGIGALVGMTSVARAHPLIAPRQVPSSIAGPADPHVAAIVYNPAGLALLRGVHFYTEGGARISSLDAKLEQFGHQRATWAAPDGFVGATANVRDRVTLALATYLPVTDLTRLPAGLSRFARRYDVTALQQTLAAGARISNRFTVGASFSFVESWGDLRFDRDVAPAGGSALVDQPSALCGNAPCGYDNPLARQQLSGSGFGWGISFAVGVLTRPIDRLWLGLNYQSRTFDRGSTNDLTLSDYRGGGATPAPGQAANVDCSSGGGRCRGNARQGMPLPNILAFAARVELSKAYELELGFRWVNYGPDPDRVLYLQGGSLDSLGKPAAAALPLRMVIDRGQRDAFLASMAVRIDALRRVRLQPYLAYESPATARSRVQPASLDGHKVDLSLVFDARLTQKVHLTGHVGLTAHAIGRVASAFSSALETQCVDAGYALASCLDRAEGRAWPSASGTYVYLQPHVGLGLDVSF